MMSTYKRAYEVACDVLARKAQRVRNYPYSENDIRIWKHEDNGSVYYVYTIGHDEHVAAREAGAVLVNE